MIRCETAAKNRIGNISLVVHIKNAPARATNSRYSGADHCKGVAMRILSHAYPNPPSQPSGDA